MQNIQPVQSCFSSSTPDTNCILEMTLNCSKLISVHNYLVDLKALLKQWFPTGVPRHPGVPFAIPRGAAN